MSTGMMSMDDYPLVSRSEIDYHAYGKETKMMRVAYVTLNSGKGDYTKIQFAGTYMVSSDAEIISGLEWRCKQCGFTDYQIHIDPVPTESDIYEEELCKRLDC